MVRTHKHLNTELRAEAKLYMHRCGRLARRAHYAVWDVLYHRLTFIMLNLPQTPRWPTCAANAKQPHPFHCQNHVCRQRLMGVEHYVTVSPCIEWTCSWKVQNEWCLPSNTLTTCQVDLLLRGPCRKCWSVPLPGGHAGKSVLYAATMRKGN